MKSYIKIFVCVGLALLIGSLTMVFGQTKTTPNGQFPKDEKREFGRVLPPFGAAPDGLNRQALEQLDLTATQKTQIRSVEENARKTSAVYFEKLEVIQEKIKDTTEGESFDESAARKFLKTKAEIQTELEIIRLKTDLAIYNILTAQQIAKLGLLKQQRSEFPPQDGMRPLPQEKF